METAKEFRKYAASCEDIASLSKDLRSKGEWLQFAERWRLCAKRAEDQDCSARQIGEQQSKGRRRAIPSYFRRGSGTL